MVAATGGWGSITILRPEAMASINGIRDVSERHLCTGCGVCAYLQPDSIEMVDDFDQGRRPLVSSGADTSEALGACPGVALEHDYDREQPDLDRDLEAHWGPVLGLWEGYAADDEIRWLGSSGGAATALSLHAIQSEGFHGVLHTGAREDAPFLNETILSTTRGELVAATGSRYAPASPCDGLDRVESAPGPCLMVGKPCDVAGARSAAALRPALAERLSLTIAVFCAGAPSTAGTLEMLERMGFGGTDFVDTVRYRGKGWPGHAEVVGRASDGAPRESRLTYADSWGVILQKHRPWRCHVCADHTGEFADIAVGDPWYRDIPEGEPGRSLLLARTERGRRFLERAIEAGAVVAQPASSSILPASQPNLLRTRGALWGRSLACRLVGVPAPSLRRLATFSAWRDHLTLREKMQSILGTWKRVVKKRLYARRPVSVTALPSEKRSDQPMGDPPPGSSKP